MTKWYFRIRIHSIITKVIDLIFFWLHLDPKNIKQWNCFCVVFF